MHFKCFIFDLDGTLVDSVADLTNAFNFMRRKLNFPEVTRETMAQLIGNGMHDVIRQSFKLANLEVSEEEVNSALKIMLDYYMDHTTDNCRAYDGVVPTLETLKKSGCKLTVVTNKFTAATLNILQALQLEQYFDCIFGNGDGFQLKPAPDLLLEAARKTNTPIADCVMVGDNHTDLGAARRAGMRSVFVTYGYGATGNETPDIVIDKFDDLKVLI